MSDNEKVPRALTAGAQCLVRIAVQKQQAGGHTQMGVYHWLLALVECHGAMAEAVVQGLEAVSLRGYLHGQLRQGNMGAPLDLETVVHRAAEHARQRGKAQAAERDLAAVILAAAGYDLAEAPPSTYYYSPASAHGQRGWPSGIGASPVPLARSETGQSGVEAGQSEFRARASRPTPALDTFGRDLTREAQEDKLSPVVGREEEIQRRQQVLSGCGS